MSHQHWTNYWKKSVNGSFGRQLPEWYQNTLEPFWENTFLPLSEDAQILDIATGNGAVIKIAARISSEQNKHFSLTATDKAKQLLPNNDESSRLSEDIHFIPDTPIEHLAFPDSHFDLVCSQFGIEYSQWKKSLAKIQPSLKKDGRLVIIAHIQDSIIHKQSKNELEQYRLILQHYPLFKKLETLIKSMGELSTPDDIQKLSAQPRANKARESFNLLVAKLLDEHDDAIIIAEFLKNIQPLFQQLMMTPVVNKIKFINSIKTEMLQARQRLIDMTNAALDAKTLQRFFETAQNLNMETITNQAITDQDNHLIAWNIELVKS